MCHWSDFIDFRLSHSLSLSRLCLILSWSFRFLVSVLECILLFYDVCVCSDRAFIWIFQKNAFGLRANVCIVCEAQAAHFTHSSRFSLLFLLLFLIQFGSIVTAFIHYVNRRQVFIICVRTHDPVTISINSNHQCESNKINNNNGNNDEIGINMKMVCVCVFMNEMRQTRQLFTALTAAKIYVIESVKSYT